MFEKGEIPDWLKESMRKHKENIDSLKLKSIDPVYAQSCGRIYFLDFDHGGKMYKEEHTISLPDFGYYWRKVKGFFKKPFQKRIDRRHRLKHYDSVCKENEELKKKVVDLEHELWKKGVYLDEAYRLLKYAKKD